MKSKKLLALSVAAIALMLSACNGAGGDNPSSSNPNPSTPSTSQVDPTTVRVTGVALNRNVFEGEVGDKVKLYANVSPSDAYNRNVVWSSSNLQVATVVDGEVTIVGKGQAIVTAKTVDGGFEDTCTVRCEDEKAQVVCYANEYVDTYCWNMDEEDIDIDAYLGATQDGHLFFEYEAGSIVYFIPDYDDEEVNLLGYKYYVDGSLYGVCGMLDYCYYLEVPEEASQLIVMPIVQKFAAPDTNEYFGISNVSQHARVAGVSGIKVNNGASYGAAGAKVEFSVNVEPGYDFVDVSVMSASGAVEATLNADGNYEFVMPSEAVEITIDTKAHNFGFVRIDEKGLINSVYVGDDKIASNISYAPCGEDITIIFNTTMKDYVAKGIAVSDSNGNFIAFMPAVQDGLGVVFNMPCFGIIVEVVWAARSYPVNLVNTDNVQLVPFAKEGDTYVALDPETLTVDYYGSVYFKVATSDPKYAPKGVQVDEFKYVTSIGSTYQSTSYAKALTQNDDGYYVFTLSYLAATQITVRVTGDLDTKAFEDTPLAGNYLGMYSWGTDRSDIAPTASYNSVIENSGSWKEGSTQYYITSYNNISRRGTYQNPSYPDRAYQFMFKDNFMFTAKDVNSLFGTYKYTYVRMEDGDTAADYEVHAETFKSGKFLAVEVLRQGESYANMFVDQDAQKIYTNVKFEMFSGEHVNVLGAVYDVKFGNNTLYRVGYNGLAGGAANRDFANPDNPRGTFVSDTGEFFEFDGFNHVKYDGKLWGCEIDAKGNATAKPIGGGKDTLTFKVYPTLGIVSDVVFTAYVYKNQLEGRIFTGKCGKYWYSSGTHANDKIVDITIEFVDDIHVKVHVISSGTIVLGNVTKPDLLDESIYTITGNTVVLDFHDKDTSYTTKSWTFNLSDDWMTLTCTSTNRLTDSAYDYVLPDKGPLTGSALNSFVA